MTANAGMIDRVLRIVVGLALVALALGYIPGQPAMVWGWIGVVPLLTGILGYCPAYSILGVNTCGKRG
ncbi:MAG: DUF2892 domain-containing protein [Hyphomicrobiaceae bacterium]|nr:DUF2892 domain-containing protein [Hyphomicrobiaceae bacterium]